MTAVMQLAPAQIQRKPCNGFLPVQPSCHLHSIILSVSGSVSLLGIIYMEPLRVFGVEAVETTKQPDCLDVVDERVELGYIEVVATAELDKDVLESMEIIVGIL